MKKIITLLALAATLTATAANDYSMLEVRANRAFEWGEWTNASTLYTLMAHERPEVSTNYARAIVCNAMTGDSVATPRLFSDAMHHGVALDSLFDGVRTAAFAIRQADIYPEFLKATRRYAPWVGRAVDARLLDWYMFRDNGPEIVRYASMMLRGLPDDPGFLSCLAHGYMLQGESRMALNTWLHVVEADPDNYTALLTAGNLAADLGDKNTAVTMLTRADGMRPSAYIRGRLERLNADAAPGQ